MTLVHYILLFPFFFFKYMYTYMYLYLSSSLADITIVSSFTRNSHRPFLLLLFLLASFFFFFLNFLHAFNIDPPELLVMEWNKTRNLSWLGCVNGYTRGATHVWTFLDGVSRKWLGEIACILTSGHYRLQADEKEEIRRSIRIICFWFIFDLLFTEARSEILEMDG